MIEILSYIAEKLLAWAVLFFFFLIMALISKDIYPQTRATKIVFGLAAAICAIMFLAFLSGLLYKLLVCFKLVH
jgi:hypothetical protein